MYSWEREFGFTSEAITRPNFKLNYIVVARKELYNQYVRLSNSSADRELIVFCISEEKYLELLPQVEYIPLMSRQIILNDLFMQQLLIKHSDFVRGKIVDNLPQFVKPPNYYMHHSGPEIDQCYIAPGYVFYNDQGKIQTIITQKEKVDPGIFLHPDKDIVEKHKANQRDIQIENNKYIGNLQQLIQSVNGIANSLSTIENEKNNHTSKYTPDIIIHKSNEPSQKILIDFSQLGIGGMATQLQTLVDQILIPRMLPIDIQTTYNITHRKGIILHGQPGTGKTLLARNIGKMFPHSIITFVKGPEMLTSYYGESERNIRALFEPSINAWKEIGEKSSLYVIVFDELDAISSTRSNCSSRGRDNAVLTQLLTMIDGLVQQQNILLVGTTNRLDLIDPAMLRPGRFDCHLHIDLPTDHERKQILNIYLKPLQSVLAPDVDIDTLVTHTEGYTGAQIKSLVNSAKTAVIKSLFTEQDSYMVYTQHEQLPTIHLSHFIPQ